MPNRLIAEAVRTIRDSRGMSQSELARRAGLAKATISDLESNVERSPGLDTLSKVADALDVHLATLIGIDVEGDAIRLDELDETAAAQMIADRGLQLAPAGDAGRRFFQTRAGFSLHAIRFHPGDVLITHGDGEPARPAAVIVQNRGRSAGFEARLYLDPYLIGPDCNGVLRHDMKQSPDLTTIGEIVTRIGTLA